MQRLSALKTAGSTLPPQGAPHHCTKNYTKHGKFMQAAIDKLRGKTNTIPHFTGDSPSKSHSRITSLCTGDLSSKPPNELATIKILGKSTDATLEELKLMGMPGMGTASALFFGPVMQAIMQYNQLAKEGQIEGVMRFLSSYVRDFNPVLKSILSVKINNLHDVEVQYYLDWDLNQCLTRMSGLKVWRMAAAVVINPIHGTVFECSKRAITPPDNTSNPEFKATTAWLSKTYLNDTDSVFGDPPEYPTAPSKIYPELPEEATIPCPNVEILSNMGLPQKVTRNSANNEGYSESV